MSGRVCITNSVPSLSPCTFRSRHMASCDGWGRRYYPEAGRVDVDYRMVWNPTTGTNERVLVECRGCLPRPAEVGFLCQSHRDRLDHALAIDPDTGARVLTALMVHLWSMDTAGASDDNDRVTVAFGSRWPLSEPRIVANGIYVAAAEAAVAYAVDLRIDEPAWSPHARLGFGFDSPAPLVTVGRVIGDLAGWIEEHATAATNRPHSAEATVRMIGVAQNALARFPLVDTDHHVAYVRCPGCGRMALTWSPPLYRGDDVVITCEQCGHVTDQDYIDAYIHAIRTDPRRAQL